MDFADTVPFDRETGSFAPRGSYFARHWRGQLSLGVSYWLNGTLLGGVLPALLVGAASAMADRESADLRVVATVSLASIALALVAQAWGMVGIWRSARRHVGRGGSAFWAGAAYVMVVLGVLSMLGNLAVRHIGGQVVELAQLAVGRDPMPAIDVKVLPGGQTVRLLGTLGSGSAERVRRVLDATPAIKLVSLQSNGGRLLEARTIAAEVRRRGLDTYVEGMCASACTMVFLAGRDRGATPNAKIGFHRASFAGLEGKNLPGADPMMASYREAGLSDAFIAHVRATPSASIWYPTQDELIANRVVTRVSLGGETIGGLVDAGSAAELRQSLNKLAMFQAIERRFPGALDRAAGAAWAARQRGANDDQMMSAARGVIGELVPQALATASDETLEAFAGLTRAELAAALAISPEACGKLLDTQLNISATLPRAVVEQDMAVTKALFDAPPRQDGPVPKAAGQRAILPALRALTAEQLKAVTAPDLFAGQPRLRCTALIAFHEAIAKLPPANRRLVLRVMYQSGA